MGATLNEDCFALDLARLMRLGPIREGMAAHGELAWSLDGQRIGAIRFRIDLRATEAATLMLLNQRPEISQMIRLTHTRPNFGGLRWWMRCPVTQERVRILYLEPGGERFTGRNAVGLNYRVERLSRFDRPFERLFCVQRRLGNVQGLGRGLERPKGMWRRTFARHAEKFETLDLDCAGKIVAMIERA